MKYFLLEMGVEEIPTAYLGALTRSLGDGVRARLSEQRLPFADVQAHGTPRRLAVFGEVAERQEPRRRQVKGPPLDRARDAGGGFTAAALGFARRLGLGTDALMAGEGVEAGYIVATVDEPEAAAHDLLPALLQEAMAALNPPRSMRWAADDRRFIRPVRWLVALLDETVLPVAAFGLEAGRVTYGNRTDYPDPFALGHAREYRAALSAHRVELTHDTRAARIRAGGGSLAAEVGGSLFEYPGLLDEVADLVEWPVPFRGEFERAALALPAPILETAMAHHQRFFPVRSAEGRIDNAFVGVRNGEGLDLSRVIRGNEKVLQARLADARFFFDDDRRRPLAARVADLDQVVLHERLGTLGDKRRRLERLCERADSLLGLSPAEVGQAVRAATLAKADLLTRMVGEFPELQGTMGGIYATQDGEDPVVAEAVSGQYHPAGPEDGLPGGRVPQALALLDRLDTLAGMEVQGLYPTGSQDPFGFRRLGLGLARILMEGGALSPVPLDSLLDQALELWSGGAPRAEARERLKEFLGARVKGYFSGKVRADVVDAVLHGREGWNSLPDRLRELDRRLAAGDFEVMAAIFKRATNLAGEAPPALVDHYPDPSEEALSAALRRATAEGGSAARGGQYWRAYWERVKDLYEPLDQFLEAVLVMDPDPPVRARRLGLLAAVADFVSRGADLQRITGERG